MKFVAKKHCFVECPVDVISTYFILSVLLLQYNITLSWTLSLNFDKWRDRTLIMDAVDSELLIYGSFHFNSTEIQ